MTDNLTETSDMSNDEATTDEAPIDGANLNPVDLLPTGDTDVLADAADIDDESDTGSDVAEEVAAVHVESDETQAAEPARPRPKTPAETQPHREKHEAHQAAFGGVV